MRALTPAERRGAAVVVLLLALGAGRDLMVARIAPRTPPPAVAAPAPVAATADTAVDPQVAAPMRLDLNRATAEELDRLPGIGPVLAQRIVEHRRRAGRFRSIDELRAVRGVGPRLLERLRPRVVAGSTSAAAGPAQPAGVQTARPAARGAADSAQVRPATIR